LGANEGRTSELARLKIQENLQANPPKQTQEQGERIAQHQQWPSASTELGC